MTTGKVKSVRSRPAEIVIQPPGDPAPPVVIFNLDIEATDLTVAAAAYEKGSDVDVSGTPPSCGGVKAK